MGDLVLVKRFVIRERQSTNSHNEERVEDLHRVQSRFYDLGFLLGLLLLLRGAAAASYWEE